MKISEVLSFLEKKCPLSYQEDFDNCGIQCGDKEREITGVLVCFEMSEETIDEAIRLNANLVISHHPLVLRKGIFKIEPIGRVGKVICKALENKMVLYSMHTNLDSAEGGLNDAFAAKLGLSNVTVLDPIDGEANVGLGRVGDLPCALPAKDFLLKLKETFDVQMIRYFGNVNQDIRRVAVLGGGGSSFIGQALAAGADAYVTGDIKYHDFHTAERRMLIADIGHFESEHFIKEIIYNELKENFNTFAVSLSEVEKLQISII